jgi:hypothetical protein
VNEYTLAGHDDYLRLLVTVATPFGGHAAARYFPGQDPPVDGPPTEPARVREVWQPAAAGSSTPHLSWRDMKPESRFLAGLLAVPLPPKTRFDLVFTWNDHVSVLESPELAGYLERTFAAVADRSRQMGGQALLDHAQVRTRNPLRPLRRSRAGCRGTRPAEEVTRRTI